MAHKDKPAADTGRPGYKGSRRIQAVTLSALLSTIFFALGAIADFSSVYGIIRRIWPQQIQPMSGDINVLYIPLASDRTVAKELVTVVSEFYGDELQQRLPRALSEFTGDHSGYNVQVRVLESLDLDADPNSVERVEQYQRVIRDHDSDIVVSGYLADTAKSIILQSEVFISDGALEGAAELGGIHYLDLSSAPIDPERSAEGRRRVRAEFVDQIEAYVRLIAAISLYVYGDNSAALSVLERVRNEWSSPQRRKVVNVFIGNAWGRLNDDMKAQSYYADSIVLDPSYARARLGLAEIGYQRGNGGCQRGSIAYEMMEQNILQYDAIFQATLGEPLDTQDILERAAFGRGRANLCLALAMPNAARFATAQDDFSFVINQFNGGKKRLRPLAAESHANRGLSLLSQKAEDTFSIEQYMDAAEEYRAAIPLLRDGVRQGVFYGMLGFIESQLGGSAARSCYLIAKELDPGRSNEYDEALTRLGESNFHLPCV